MRSRTARFLRPRSGTEKTRLALHLACNVADDFPDGASLCEAMPADQFDCAGSTHVSWLAFHPEHRSRSHSHAKGPPAAPSEEWILRGRKTGVQGWRHARDGIGRVYTGWGLNTRELERFVALGMTPEQALQTATRNPAAMLGMEKSLGAVAPGYYADPLPSKAIRPPISLLLRKIFAG
jgi:Amidohydrolase family